MNENAFWLRLWQSILLTILLVVAICSMQHLVSLNWYTQRGYCRASLMGAGDPAWTKCP